MDLSKLNAENCLLKRSQGPIAFQGLCSICLGDPCSTGCFHYNNGGCKGYQAAMCNTHIKSNPCVYKFSNAEIAGELNVSKREVSRMRKNDTLPGKYK